MYRIGIVLLPEFYLSSMSGLMDSLQVANAHIRNQQSSASVYFQCDTISQGREAVVSSSGITIEADSTIENTDKHYDLIYLPGFYYHGIETLQESLQQQAPLLKWLKQQYQEGTRLAANCTGTFTLAETGLLNGREATTSWWLEHQFKNLYPLVKLKARELLTEDDLLLCSGSMSASLNLATRVIDRFHSHAMAIQCAKVMLVNNNDQAQYQELITDIPSGDPVVAKCQYWLQTHLREKIDQPALAQKMGTSQRTLIRKFKSELGVPPLTYLQNLRIETAKHLLESSTLALSEIIGRVGYTDISSFSRLFRQRTDLTPAAYRRRFKVV